MNRALDRPKEQAQEVIVHNSEALLRRLDSWKEANCPLKEANPREAAAIDVTPTPVPDLKRVGPAGGDE
jgi:hypothetical protein